MANSDTGRDSGPVYFTTHQVGKLLGVSMPTVVNWVRGGRLEAHRTPGGHRRIHRDELVRFASAHRYPLPDSLRRQEGPQRVLIVDAERDFAEMVSEYLSLKSNFEVRVAHSPFAAGLEIGRFKPGVIVADLGLLGAEAARLASTVASADGPTPRLIGCLSLPDPTHERDVLAWGFDAFLRKPVMLDELLTLISRLAA